jgi:hypothetical protein
MHIFGIFNPYEITNVRQIYDVHVQCTLCVLIRDALGDACLVCHYSESRIRLVKPPQWSAWREPRAAVQSQCFENKMLYETYDCFTLSYKNTCTLERALYDISCIFICFFVLHFCNISVVFTLSIFDLIIWLYIYRCTLFKGKRSLFLSITWLRIILQ